MIVTSSHVKLIVGHIKLLQPLLGLFFQIINPSCNEKDFMIIRKPSDDFPAPLMKFICLNGFMKALPVFLLSLQVYEPDPYVCESSVQIHD